MYSTSTISNYFINKYADRGNITPMKLIKLVYIAHGWYLGMTGNALIDENPEAWKYGPVIPSIYHAYKQYKNNPIIINKNENYSTGNTHIDRFLDKIWEVYGKFSGTELSAKTHQLGTPWSKTWNALQANNRHTLQIPEIDITDHYKILLNGKK